MIAAAAAVALFGATLSPGFPLVASSPLERGAATDAPGAVGRRASPAVTGAQQGTPAAAGQQRIVGIRFHGNYSLDDEALRAAAGIENGVPLTPQTLALIKQRLEDVEGVGSVAIRQRYRSMSSTEEVVLLITVEETVSVGEKFMFLPVFTWTDEYGITLGARFTFIDLLGADERVSFPLTWFGEKKAAAELSFDLDNAAITRIDGGVGILRRRNPHYDIDDTRWGGRIEGTKRWGMFQVGGNFMAENVTFADVDTRQLVYGAEARLDTRQDALLPRNAVYLGASWSQLYLLDRNSSINRYEVDLRGFKSAIGRTILAGQGYYRGADGPLPDWEKPFLGGAQTVRGYDAGEFIGDNIALVAAELRVPITPPAPVGLVGLNFFIDSGTVYDHGTKLGDARFVFGAGGGIYFFVAFIGLQIDAAYGFQSEEVHFHFSTGFRF